MLTYQSDCSGHDNDHDARCRHVRCWNSISDRAHSILEGRRFGTPESVGLPVWLVAVGGYKVESLAFQLPRSSKSARTYSFSSPLHLLVDPILLRTSYVASLAYQRLEGKRETSDSSVRR